MAKKVKLLDATTKYVYTDEFGIMENRVALRLNNYDYSVLEIRENGAPRKLKREDFWDLPKLFNQDIYYYGNKIIVKEASYGATSSNVKATLNNYSSFNKLYETYVYEVDSNTSEFLYDYEIEEGMLIYYTNSSERGTYKVTELYPQPNNSKNLCRIESLVNGKEIIVPCTSYNANGKVANTNSMLLHKVPYAKYNERKNELVIFNESINEKALQPFAECFSQDRTKANVYWQSIPEASQYIVALYKYVARDDIKAKLYHLQDYIVERNVCRQTLDNLAYGEYIVTITAEDRGGNEIAKSRGIRLKWGNLEYESIHFPGFFDKTIENK